MNKIDKSKFLNLHFILSAAAFAVALAGLIAIIISNGVPGFSLGSIAWFIIELVVALLCIGGAAALYMLFDDKELFVTGLNLAAVVMVMLAFAGIIGQRAILASAQFTYDAENLVGWRALNSSIATVVACVISAVLLAVEAFFPAKKSQN